MQERQGGMMSQTRGRIRALCVARRKYLDVVYSQQKSLGLQVTSHVNLFAVFLWREKQILIQLSLPMSRWVGRGFSWAAGLRRFPENKCWRIVSLVSNLSFIIRPQDNSEGCYQISSLSPQMQKNIHIWSFNALQNESGSKGRCSKNCKIVCIRVPFSNCGFSK